MNKLARYLLILMIVAQPFMPVLPAIAKQPKKTFQINWGGAVNKVRVKNLTSNSIDVQVVLPLGLRRSINSIHLEGKETKYLDIPLEFTKNGMNQRLQDEIKTGRASNTISFKDIANSYSKQFEMYIPKVEGSRVEIELFKAYCNEIVMDFEFEFKGLYIDFPKTQYKLTQLPSVLISKDYQTSFTPSAKFYSLKRNVIKLDPNTATRKTIPLYPYFYSRGNDGRSVQHTKKSGLRNKESIEIRFNKASAKQVFEEHEAKLLINRVLIEDLNSSFKTIRYFSYNPKSKSCAPFDLVNYTAQDVQKHDEANNPAAWLLLPAIPAMAAVAVATLPLQLLAFPFVYDEGGPPGKNDPPRFIVSLEKKKPAIKR